LNPNPKFENLFETCFAHPFFSADKKDRAVPPERWSTSLSSATSPGDEVFGGFPSPENDESCVCNFSAAPLRKTCLEICSRQFPNGFFSSGFFDDLPHRQPFGPLPWFSPRTESNLSVWGRNLFFWSNHLNVSPVKD